MSSTTTRSHLQHSGIKNLLMSTLRQPGGWPVSKHTIISSNPYIIFVIRTHRKMEHSYRDFFLFDRAWIRHHNKSVCCLFIWTIYCVVFTQAVSGCYTRVIAYYDPINRCIIALFMSVFININWQESVRDTVDCVSLHYIVLHVHCIIITSLRSN